MGEKKKVPVAPFLLTRPLHRKQILFLVWPSTGGSEVVVDQHWSATRQIVYAYFEAGVSTNQYPDHSQVNCLFQIAQGFPPEKNLAGRSVFIAGHIAISCLIFSIF